MRLVLVVVVFALVVGCNSSPAVPSPTPPPTPSPAPSSIPSGCANDLPLPTPEATPACATPPASQPTASPPGFQCQLPIALPETTSDPAPLTDVVVLGDHGGYDRVAFVFDKGLPALQVKQVQPPFTTDPAGLPLDVSGNVFVELRFEHAARDLTHDVPRDLAPNLGELIALRMEGDFEGVVTYIAGLAEPPCLRVQADDAPSRFVIDIQAGQ